MNVCYAVVKVSDKIGDKIVRDGAIILATSLEPAQAFSLQKSLASQNEKVSYEVWRCEKLSAESSQRAGLC